MSDSDWRKFLKDRGGLVVALFVAALFAITLLQLARSWQWETDYNASRNAANYAADAKNDVAGKCAGLTGQARDDCSDKIDDAAREHQRNEYDLAAQQTMALWTAVMGGMAVVGIGLSGVGVYLIWQTWAETRNANLILMATDKRLNEAKISAPSGMNLVAIKDSQLGISIENRGNTRASNVDMKLHIEICDESGELDQEITPEPLIAGVEMEPKAQLHIPFDVKALKVDPNQPYGPQARAAITLIYITEYGERITITSRYEGRVMAADVGILFSLIPGTQTKVEPTA